MENYEKKRNSWVIILIGDEERRGPFEITRGTIILSIICFVAVLGVITVGSSWLYNCSCISTNNRLAKELANAKQSIELISQEKESFAEEIERFKTEIQNLREKRGNPASAEKKKEITVTAAKRDAEVETRPLVSLEEIQMAYDAGSETIKVVFTIKNQGTDEKYISGYIFTILNPAPGSSALHKSSPVAELAGGFPRSYKRGERFSIARFKQIEGVFPSISDRDKYDSVTILVYSDDGALRLKKELSL